MAKTPVSMTIDGYKEREVLMVTYEFSQAMEVIKREVFLKYLAESSRLSVFFTNAHYLLSGG